MAQVVTVETDKLLSLKTKFLPGFLLNLVTLC